MKTLKYLILPAFLLHLSLNAQESVTLKETQQLAKEHYPLIKRNGLIEKTQTYTLENIA